MKIKIMLWRISFAVLACVCAEGCRTTQDVLHDYEANLIAGNYGGSTEELLALADKKDGSELLWRLLAASTLYLSEAREADAIRHFDLAEDVMKNHDQTSAFAQGGEGAFAMLTNDRAFAYDGGGLDRVFTCVYRGIDFLRCADSDNARVEFNRAAQYQRNWLYERRKDIYAAAKKLETEASAYQRSKNVQAKDMSSSVNTAMSDASFGAVIREKTGFDPATSGLLDSLPQAAYVNAYAAHLAGVFRWINGDNEVGDLKLAAEVKPNVAQVVCDYAECGQGMKPSNQVWIWAEDGLCPTREEWRLDLPLFFMPFVGNYAPYVGMALPVLRMRGAGATSWRVAASDGAVVQMEELADVDKLIKTEYDVYMRGAIAREITRTMVKAGVQVALGVAADAAERRAMKKGNSADYWALKMSQMAVAAWAMATTGADLRSWTALPKTVKVARVTRPADGRIDVWADGQKIELTLESGNSLVFIRKPSPQANPAVKQVTFKR